MLQDSRHSDIFNFILITIFEHIHTWDGVLYGYPCPMYDDPHDQISHDIQLHIPNNANEQNNSNNNANNNANGRNNNSNSL